MINASKIFTPGVFQATPASYAACTRGNRRGVINTVTATLKDAYYHNEKNVTAERLYNSVGFNESK
ncbi:MAG: hypothetical protein CSA29_01930 [Desulfobacterales bacterium]|nr:MAG: hypothetical protein CSA29_01930 [Desulfobacterales bacterium]